MREPSDHPDDHDTAEEAAVRRLLSGAGARVDPPAADLAAIKAAFTEAWEARTQARPTPFHRRPALRWALAAGLLLGLAAGWWWSQHRAPAALVARVERVNGEAFAGTSPVTVGDELPVGARLRTAEAGGTHLALRLAGGPSLRLAAGSELRLVSATEASLRRGAVYVDSGAHPSPGAVRLGTPWGLVRDVGTQFEVRLLPGGEALQIRVREGEVQLDRPAGTLAARAGSELRVGPGDAIERQAIATGGPLWQWAVEAAPPFALEGSSLADFLAWVCRETGWRLDYAEPGLAAAAAGIVLHGSIARLDPAQALTVVLPGAGLHGEVVDGVLHVAHTGDDRPPAGSGG